MERYTRVKWRWVVGLSLIAYGLWMVPNNEVAFGGTAVFVGFLFLKGVGEDAD